MAKARPSIEGTCYDALGLCLWSRTLGVGRPPIRFASTCPRVGTFVRPFHSIAGDFEGEVVVELRTWEGRFQVHVFPLDLGLVGRLRHRCGKVRRLRSGSELPWSRGTGRRIIRPSVHPSIHPSNCIRVAQASLLIFRGLASSLLCTNHPTSIPPWEDVPPSWVSSLSYGTPVHLFRRVALSSTPFLPFQARPSDPKGGEGEGASRP